MDQPRDAGPPDVRQVSQAPKELTEGRLRRLGEGIGKVVYASEHWVVKRERTEFEIVALIVLWNVLRKLRHLIPQRLHRRLLQGPSKQIRMLRMLIQGLLLLVPKRFWFTPRIRGAWQLYRKRDIRGQRLAEEYLAGTLLIPQRVQFPPTRVGVIGWPGSLIVSEAMERVETTLHDKLVQLAKAGDFEAVDDWLQRFLKLRQAGWQRGLFSVDAHLKNFGVCGDRLVLLDTGGLTNRWQEIENTLAFEDVVAQPHIQLGLGPVLARRPDIAERFNASWKAVVNPFTVRQNWPTASPTR